MRIAVLSHDQRRRCAVALAALAGATAIGWASIAHSAPSATTFTQSNVYTNPNPGAGPSPIVHRVVRDADPSTSEIGFDWTRHDEGAASYLLLSCHQELSPNLEDLPEACDLEWEGTYGAFELGAVESVGPAITFGAQRDYWYMIEQSADGTWRTVEHIRLGLPYQINLPIVVR